MKWREFSYLLAGLNARTPLGQIVSIRAEKDPEVLKHFTADQKRIRNEYLKKKAKAMSPQEAMEAAEMFKQAFIRMAGGQNEKTEV